MWYLFLLICGGFALSAFLKYKQKSRVQQEDNYYLQRYTPVIIAATVFWREALCRDWEDVSEEQLSAFEDALFNELLQRHKQCVGILQFGMSISELYGTHARQACDAIFEPAQRALATAAGAAPIKLDLLFPLVEMRILEDKISIRATDTFDSFSDWHLVYADRVKSLSMVELGQRLRPSQAWRYRQLTRTQGYGQLLKDIA